MRLVSALLIFSSLVLNESYGQESCTADNSLRINPTAQPFMSTARAESGRLEICNCGNNGNCTWNTILANTLAPWSWKNVQVACRQLGRNTGSSFSGLGNPVLHDSAPDERILYSQTFNCDGTERNLTDCNLADVSFPLTNTATEVFITCLKTALTGQIKLTATTTPHQGIIEMYVRATGQWETVCIDGFNDHEADVACRTLGYASGVGTALMTNPLQENSQEREINTTPGIFSIQCSGTERDIDSCFVRRDGSCRTNEMLAGAICMPSSDDMETTRLFTLSQFNDYMRVEVLFAGRWGTVCDSTWDITDGQVTCRSLELGVDDAEIPDNFVSIFQSQRPLWVPGYICNGTETNLTLCNLTNPVGFTAECTHREDAGLLCGEVPRSGLSGGAIAGIVIGVLVFVCCACCAVAAIVVCCCFCDWDDVEISCSCTNCNKCERRRSRRRTRRSSLQVDEPVLLREIPRESSSPSNVEPNEEEPKEEIHEDAELSKPPPPSYNDALVLEGVIPPPEYVEKPAEKLPYPTIDSDPAYPPPLERTSTDEQPAVELPYPTIDSDPAYPPLPRPVPKNTEV